VRARALALTSARARFVDIRPTGVALRGAVLVLPMREGIVAAILRLLETEVTACATDEKQ
jgi:hypothetical protein